MMTDEEELAEYWVCNDLLADPDLVDGWMYVEPSSDEYLAECWDREVRLTTVYRMTWQEPQYGLIESQRLIGQDAVVRKTNFVRPRWFTVEEWRGHDIGWVRLWTMVRNRAGQYKRLRVN